MAPKWKILKYTDLDNNEIFEISSTIELVTTAFEKSLNSQGTTIYFSEYSDESDQIESINHFHVHIIPRKEGDFEKKSDIYNFIKAFDKDFIRFYKTKLKNDNAIS